MIDIYPAITTIGEYQYTYIPQQKKISVEGLKSINLNSFMAKKFKNYMKSIIILSLPAPPSTTFIQTTDKSYIFAVDKDLNGTKISFKYKPNDILRVTEPFRVEHSQVIYQIDGTPGKYTQGYKLLPQYTRLFAKVKSIYFKRALELTNEEIHKVSTHGYSFSTPALEQKFNKSKNFTERGEFEFYWKEKKGKEWCALIEVERIFI